MPSLTVGVGVLVVVGLVMHRLPPKATPIRMAALSGGARGQGPSQIFSFAPDGSDRKQLTSSGANYQPSWSANGKRILFSSNHEIWVMNADGGEKRKLTFNTRGGNFTPVESPDGKHIAFTGIRGNIPPKVWIMNADGSSQKRLTVTPRVLPKVVRTKSEELTLFYTLPPKVRKIGTGSTRMDSEGRQQGEGR